MVDWNAGSYERIAPEFAAVAQQVVARADPAAGRHLVDIACGTGNAALLAARRGAQVTGVDSAERLLEVGRRTAASEGLAGIEFVAGDLQALPLPDAGADVAVSVFGLIFATDPQGALAEAARILRPGGRLIISAWIPAGPIDAMLTVVGATIGRLTGAAAPPRFAWSQADALAPVAAAGGLQLVATTGDELAIRAASPAAYVADGARDHPMSLATEPVLERAGLLAQTRARMAEVLANANEDPDALLVHSPYVIHELRRAD